MKTLSTKKQGFTIIEVVLVLAIAGLIFLMVFVALPALQRSQRDTARRNDMSRVDTALIQYQTNHNNSKYNLPTSTLTNGHTYQAAYWLAPSDKSFKAENKDNCGTNIACQFVRDYMNSGSTGNDEKTNTFIDPDGTPYSVTITPNWEKGANIEGTSTKYSKLAAKDESNLSAGYTIVDNNGRNAYDGHMIYIIPGARRIGDAATPSTKNHFAVMYRLEGAGVYCIDDQ